MKIRPIRESDMAFLRQMLYAAATWRPGVEHPPLEALLATPELGKLLAGWGRRGDFGLVAENGEEPCGAAWYRLWTDHDHSYGYVAADVPELAIAVVRRRRGAGIGGALLLGLIEAAVRQGHRRLSLSVEVDNPARRLYSRCGFVRCGHVGNADTMVRALSTDDAGHGPA